MKKMQVKSEISKAAVTDIRNETDLSSYLSQELAKEIDKSIIDGLFEINRKDNVEILEKIFPGREINSVCKEIGVKDLKKEYNLIQKIRDWKINNLSL